jgi:tetratricopeptide (TPR) repeat protein/TolB-like protein
LARMADFHATMRAAVADRYVIERTLGTGGMATVFLGVDLKHGSRRVAIKVLRPELAAALGIDRFLHEIRLTAKLQHPHIVPLFDSGTVDTLPFYVMPWVVGESLRERLEREKHLPIDEAIRITVEIAHALAHAHEHGIVHRDVKPENILFSAGEAMLADFGIARAVLEVGGTKLTGTGIAIGTPAYMSPEQADPADTIGPRSDIYSLGCVLYEMLVGDPPFTGSSAQAIVARKSAGPAPALRSVRDAISDGLERVVLKSLARIPADRYDSATAFATALTQPDDRARPRKPLGNRALVTAGVFVVIGAVAVILAVTRASGRPDARRFLVTSFQNETRDSTLDKVGEITVDWLIRELQNTALVQVVDQRALTAATGDSVTRAPVELARQTRAGKMISLSYYTQGDSIRFQTHIVESASRVTLYASQPTAAPLAAPLDRLETVSQDLVGAVVTLVAPGVEWQSSGEHPPTFAAYNEFMAGLASLPRLDFGGAIQHWFRSARLDTTFVTPLLSAASFMLVAGQNARADSLVSSLERKRDRLHFWERQRLDNLRARLHGDLPEALEALRPLVAAAPFSEPAWELALHELWVNQPRAAIPAFRQLDPKWEFMRGWWFYWAFYANAHHLLGDYQTELSVARQGRAQYSNSMLVAEAEVAPLVAVGHIDEVNALLDEIVAMPGEGPGELARVMMTSAEELRAHGYQVPSAATAQRARTIVQRWSVAQHAAAPAWLPALISYVSGDWVNARVQYVALARRDSSNVNAQGHLGVIAARLGDRREALRISAWLEHLDPTYQYGYQTLWRARIAALLGEREIAIDLLRRAFSEGLKYVGTFLSDSPARTFGPWLHRDIDFESLRDVSEFQRLMHSRP